MSDRNDGTGEGLLEFLQWAARTGEMTPGTANAWAAAARQVLGIEDDPDAVDLRGLDVESFFDRFEALNRTKYSAGSMSTYRSRFRLATSTYLAWLDNDPNWRPAKRAGRKPKAAKQPDAAKTTAPEPSTQAPIPSPQHGSTARLVTYTVPLRPDLMVSIALPADLTSRDAERIGNFVRSLAFDSPADEGGS